LAADAEGIHVNAKFSQFVSTRGLVASSCVACGCLPSPPPLESGGPRVVDVRAEGHDTRGVSLWSPIHVVLRGRVSGDSLRQVTVTPMVATAHCVVSDQCERGPCDAGRCWGASMTAGDLAALDDGDFGGGWPVSLALSEADADGHVTLRVSPIVAWRPGLRYRVQLGAEVRSPGGAPMEAEVDAGEVTSGRWAWEFFAARAAVPARLVWPPAVAGGPPLDVPLDLSHLEVVGRGTHEPNHLSLAAFDEGEGLQLIGLAVDGACVISDADDCARYRLEGALLPDRAYGLLHHRAGETSHAWNWSASVTATLAPRSRAFEPEASALSWSGDRRCLYAQTAHAARGILRVELGSETRGAGAPQARYEGPSGNSNGGPAAWGIPVVHEPHGGGAVAGAVPVARGSTERPAHDVVTWRYTSAWRTSHGRVEVETKGTTAPAAPLRITEVLADPLGPEPAQEYVEIQATAAAAWGPSELWIADRSWDEVRASLELSDSEPVGDPLPPATATAGEILLVVPESFVADTDEDGAVPTKTQLLRVEGSLGANGLLNAGEAVTVYQVDPPRLVASFGARGGVLAAGPGTSVVRADLTSPCDAPADWRAGPKGAPTPGSLP